MTDWMVLSWIFWGKFGLLIYKRYMNARLKSHWNKWKDQQEMSHKLYPCGCRFLLKTVSSELDKYVIDKALQDTNKTA